MSQRGHAHHRSIQMGPTEMSSIISNLRKRHLEARSDRAISRMIANAGSQTMRDELIILNQRAQDSRNR